MNLDADLNLSKKSIAKINGNSNKDITWKERSDDKKNYVAGSVPTYSGN